jgi:hypothetical protein
LFRAPCDERIISSFATPLRSGRIVLLLQTHHQIGTTFFRITPNKEDGRIKEQPKDVHDHSER